MDSVRKFLQIQNIDDLWEDDFVFWIDHRDDDESIVECCEEQLNTGKLNAEYLDAQNELGFELKITYGDKDMIVPFSYYG